jgi:hypothetical protein
MVRGRVRALHGGIFTEAQDRVGHLLSLKERLEHLLPLVRIDLAGPCPGLELLVRLRGGLHLQVLTALNLPRSHVQTPEIGDVF